MEKFRETQKLELQKTMENLQYAITAKGELKNSDLDLERIKRYLEELQQLKETLVEYFKCGKSPLLTEMLKCSAGLEQGFPTEE